MSTSKIIYQSSKTYTHAEGLSCCFRQWRANSHCNLLHGYALQVTIVFESNQLDHRNWVQDFGGLKGVKEWLKKTFDHKTLVAKDDPDIGTYHWIASIGLIDLVEVEACGCEAFARMIFEHLQEMRGDDNFYMWSDSNVHVKEVEVREHGGNGAKVIQHVQYD